LRNFGHGQLFEFCKHEDLALFVIERIQECMNQPSCFGPDRGLHRPTLAAVDGHFGQRLVRIVTKRARSVFARDAKQDSEEPCLDGRAIFELVQATMDDQEHVLNGVVDRRVGNPEAPNAAVHEVEVITVHLREIVHRARRRGDDALGSG
jgi:hypothetical protein